MDDWASPKATRSNLSLSFFFLFIYNTDLFHDGRWSGHRKRHGEIEKKGTQRGFTLREVRVGRVGCPVIKRVKLKARH